MTVSHCPFLYSRTPYAPVTEVVLVTKRLSISASTLASSTPPEAATTEMALISQWSFSLPTCTSSGSVPVSKRPALMLMAEAARQSTTAPAPAHCPMLSAPATKSASWYCSARPYWPGRHDQPLSISRMASSALMSDSSCSPSGCVPISWRRRRRFWKSV